VTFAPLAVFALDSTTQLSVESDVIRVRNARLANRINLHLALGGSFEATRAVVPIK
jgi:hypothetical protein